MHKPLYTILLGLLCFACFSCEKKVPTPLPEEEGIDDTPKFLVIFPPNGPGDNGYLDKVLSAVSRFSIKYPGIVRIMQTSEFNTDSLGGSLLLPSIDYMTMDEAQDDTTLAIFVGTEFKEILYNSDAPEGKLKVLLLEDDGVGAPEWLHTGKIDRYGASYLSGAMVEQQRAIIIAAMPGDPVLEPSIEGFKKGYESVKGREVDSVYYLADDFTGYTMQRRARAIVDSIQQNDMLSYYTIFPLAGAANIGTYSGLYEVTFMQAIGMDNDYSAISDNIPFSINIRIDAILQEYLEQWHATQQLPKRRIEGLDSKYVEIVFNPTWNSTETFFDWEDEDQIWSEEDWDVVLTSEFWKQRYEQFIDKAIEEEKTYARY
jgi:hypothetical protein